MRYDSLTYGNVRNYRVQKVEALSVNRFVLDWPFQLSTSSCLTSFPCDFPKASLGTEFHVQIEPNLV
jgi:hypothetical protein